MEAGSCVKAVVTAGNHYRNNPSEDHLVHLQRQLDVLVSITAKGSCIAYFDPTQLLPTECLATLVDILTDSDVPQLTLKIMMLLSDLANEDEIRSALHETYNITHCLSRQLRVAISSGAAGDSITQACLKLILRVSYDTQLNLHQDTYTEELLKILIKYIQGPETEATELSLGVLANLCRHSYSIHAHIKNMEGIKDFNRKLMSFLGHRNQTIMIFALSIFAALYLHDEVGKPIFGGQQNINQMFQLMFNNLVNGKTLLLRKYTTDLFIDILKHSRIQTLLAGYDHLESCLKQVLDLIGSSGTESVTVIKVFELLLAMFGVRDLRSVVCNAIISDTTVPPPRGRKKNAVTSSTLMALIKWSYSPAVTGDRAPLLALQIINEVCKESVVGGHAVQIDNACSQILPLITETFKSPLDCSKHTYNHTCSKIICAGHVLQTLYSNENLRVHAVKTVDVKACRTLLDYQLEHNRLSHSTTHHQDDPRKTSEQGAELVLHILDLLLCVSKKLSIAEPVLLEYLTDKRIISFLAFGITAPNRVLVSVAMRLLSVAAPCDSFPAVLLGESIAARNTEATRAQYTTDYTPLDGPPPAKRSAWNLDNKENFASSTPLTNKTAASATQFANNTTVLAAHSTPEFGNVSHVSSNVSHVSSIAVQSLIEKMQSGLELKDLRASEIISVYEHQIQALQTKEHHLQDLLEAKALALTQADRLIAQTRCRKAQMEAESGKLRCLVRESERRSEEAGEKVNKLQQDQERMSSDIDSLHNENIRLNKTAKEYGVLVQAYAEQKTTLENSQRSLAHMQQEYESMQEMHKVQAKHVETLKQQHDVTSKQLVDLEEERKTLSKKFKETDKKLQEYTKNFTKSEERLKKTVKERDDLEEGLEKLRDSLSKAEESKKKLKHQVASLEVLYRQSEESLREKEAQLKNNQSELEKHSKIQALINQLSSGKTPDL